VKDAQFGPAVFRSCVFAAPGRLISPDPWPSAAGDPTNRRIGHDIGRRRGTSRREAIAPGAGEKATP